MKSGFKYQAVRMSEDPEETHEWGVVCATTEDEATRKLKEQGLIPVQMRRLYGFKGFLSALRADIK